MQMDKPVLSEIEHFRGKITDEQLEAINDVLDRNEDVFFFRSTSQTLGVVILLSMR